MLKRENKNTTPPCACCGKPSEVDCWQYVLCVACHARWHAEVGVPPDSARWSPDNNVSQAAWRKVTQDWLSKAKGRAA